MSSKVNFEVMFNQKGLIKTPLLITFTNLHEEFFRQYGDAVHFPQHSVFQDGFPPHIQTTSIRLIQSHFQTLNFNFKTLFLLITCSIGTHEVSAGKSFVSNIPQLVST